jgi:predicted transcriptional regulator of viral defense system
VELPPIGNPDLVTVALRVPNAVICLISALAFHEMTTQIPHGVFVAIPIQSRRPELNHPPLFVHRFSGASYTAGVEEQRIDGVPVNIYSPEKTIADCFKFRNKTWCWRRSNSTKPANPSNSGPCSTMPKSAGFRT